MHVQVDGQNELQGQVDAPVTEEVDLGACVLRAESLDSSLHHSLDAVGDDADGHEEDRTLGNANNLSICREQTNHLILEREEQSRVRRRDDKSCDNERIVELFRLSMVSSADQVSDQCTGCLIKSLAELIANGSDGHQDYLGRLLAHSEQACEDDHHFPNPLVKHDHNRVRNAHAAVLLQILESTTVWRYHGGLDVDRQVRPDQHHEVHQQIREEQCNAGSFETEVESDNKVTREYIVNCETSR